MQTTQRFSFLQTGNKPMPFQLVSFEVFWFQEEGIILRISALAKVNPTPSQRNKIAKYYFQMYYLTLLLYRWQREWDNM